MDARTYWVDIDVDVPPDSLRIFTTINALVSYIILYHLQLQNDNSAIRQNRNLHTL